MEHLRFGLCIDQNLGWDETVELWKLYESLGFDSLWDCDHLVQPSRPGFPYHEGWTLLGGLAAVTTKARIGVLVSCNTFRHPSLLAKIAATVDHISHGRLDVGLGAGWFKPEHDMFGIEFPETPELVARFREAVQLVDGLLRNDSFSFDGRYYQVRDASFRPHPVQQPRPPFMIGAKGPVMLKIAAQYADTWNSSGTPDEMRQRQEILDAHCHAIGRDPNEIVRSHYYWLAKSMINPWDSEQAFQEAIGPYIEAGVQEFIIDHPREKQQLGILERVASDVLPSLRQASIRSR